MQQPFLFAIIIYFIKFNIPTTEPTIIPTTNKIIASINPGMNPINPDQISSNELFKTEPKLCINVIID